MKSSKPPFILKSFEGLKGLLEKWSLTHPHFPIDIPPNPEVRQDPEHDEKLFKDAMAGVHPISRDNCREKSPLITRPDVLKNDGDAEVLVQLGNLITKGEGFVVANTPEYIEGTGYNVHPWIAKRLHQGDFAIEAYIDLHGLQVTTAKEVFDQFLKESIRTGKRAVLIVHGRGLCSPLKPVLKTKVVEWLTRSFWRKWVIAFASARPCDGGTGATYALLRQRPFTRRFRKKPKARMSSEPYEPKC
ncbi:MAG: Smr/MutS family protein [Pseudomonadota bacterium]